ncbi:MAG: hypothetical protein HZB43_05260 [candidate division Zixibacteria bacterium]|nr:hypothetical protein [candidate division Zixibacteria bacterium]
MRFDWSHIPGRIVFAGFLLEMAVGSIAWAQQPDTRSYESEEDLWEALHEREISFDDYLDLIDQARWGEDTRSVPVSDWEALPGSNAGFLAAPDSGIEIAQPSRGTSNPSTAHSRWSWRSGYNADLTDSTPGTGYTLARIHASDFTGVIDWRHDGTHGVWQRRLLSWQSHGLALQMGNVEPRLGRGLVVGRRSRLVGSASSAPANGDWWQPLRSRFNGLWLSAGESRTISGDLVVSDVRSTRLIERMAALQLTAGTRSIRVGVIGLTGTVARRDSAGTYTERIAGSHIRLGQNERQILAEIAIDRQGATAKAAEALWRFDGGRFHGRAWSYAAGYTNPWGGGPGHSDTRTIVLDGIAERFASRTAGERGFSLATRLNPVAPILGGGASIDWEWLTHREGDGEPVQQSWTVHANWKRGNLRVRPFARGRTDSSGTAQHGFGSSLEIGTSERRMNTRVELGRHNERGTKYLRTSLSMKWNFSEALRLEPAVRWYDPDLQRPADGYWYFYFTEVITVASMLRLEAALVWQRYEARSKEGNVEIRIRMVGGR